MEQKKTVLSLCAHPDDTEFMSAGVLALLHDKGWEVHIGTMTPGDCGSAEYNREEISKIRRCESANAAKVLDGDYHCMECDDVFIMYNRESIRKVVELLRKVRPTIVFAPSHIDYMLDHEITSNVVQTACFASGMPNVEIEGAEAFEPVPHLYYVDPLGGLDKLGDEVEPRILVDITTKIDVKKDMLCCHASQRNWLLAHHGIDEYVISMKRFAEKRGKAVGCKYAEGFRQHLGHGYPEDNILEKELGGLVHSK